MRGENLVSAFSAESLAPDRLTVVAGNMTLRHRKFSRLRHGAAGGDDRIGKLAEQALQGDGGITGGGGQIVLHLICQDNLGRGLRDATDQPRGFDIPLEGGQVVVVRAEAEEDTVEQRLLLLMILLDDHILGVRMMKDRNDGHGRNERDRINVGQHAESLGAPRFRLAERIVAMVLGPYGRGLVEERSDRGDQHRRRMYVEIRTGPPVRGRLQDHRIVADELVQKLVELLANERSAHGRARRDVKTVEPRNMQEDVAIVLSAIDEPGIALVGHAALRVDENTRLPKRRFDTKELRQLRIVPVTN